MYDFLPTIKRLLPKGKAFKLFFGSTPEKIMKANALQAGRMKDFFDNVRDAGIPNGKLPVEALPDWEEFLALQGNSALSSQERNDRINGKYTAQGGQGPDYIQDTLQAAGYPVYLQENPAPRIDPRTVSGLLIPCSPVYYTEKTFSASLGGTTMGQKSLGAYAGTGVYEYQYAIPADSSRWVFFNFLTGPGGVGDFVDISASKKHDFITQLIQIKPNHIWMIAQINFI